MQKVTEGSSFLSGLNATERSGTIHRQNLSSVASGILFNTWCRLRGPFLIPDNVTNHSCEGHWEKFDVDKAACMTCGNLHVCSALHCDTSCENDGFVCNVTGLHLGPRLLSQYETPSDTTCDTFSQKNKVKSSDRSKPHTKKYRQVTQALPFHTENITRVIQYILLSATTQQSVDNENKKMNNRLRTVCMRKMRHCRLNHEPLNICELESHLHFKLNGLRIPPPTVDESMEQRSDCARRAAIAITQLLQFMRTHCGNVPTSVRQGGIVTGMLYMMRTGVTIDDITVLPRISELKRLLPMEQHLMAFFNIRPKIVTEAENVIKYHLRNISPQCLSLLAQTHCITRTN
jgi:hypothetical protein